MAAPVANDFLVWSLGAPVSIAGADSDFDVWQYGAPVLDLDESDPSAEPRRRADIT